MFRGDPASLRGPQELWYSYEAPNMFAGSILNLEVGTHPLRDRDRRRRRTGQDHHSKLVDYDIFVRVALPHAADPQRLYNPADFDFA